MKKACSLALIFALLTAFLPVGGCNYNSSRTTAFYDVFDSFVGFTAYGLSSNEFDTISEGLHTLLLDFHTQTDIYHDGGAGSLYRLNHSGGDAHAISRSLYDFLIFGKGAYALSEGKLNICLGAVTALWHDARSSKNPVPPAPDALQAASKHCSIDSLEIWSDDAGCYACLTDPDARLDVGALAKGYAGDLASAYLAECGVENYLLNLGGSIFCKGEPLGSGRKCFRVGIVDAANPESNYKVLELTDAVITTSGDYERYFEYEGVRYSHLIDPDTLFPATFHHSVTIVGASGAMGDLLSTAFFLSETAAPELLPYTADVIYQ